MSEEYIAAELGYLKDCLNPNKKAGIVTIKIPVEKQLNAALKKLIDEDTAMLYADFGVEQGTGQGRNFAYQALLKAEEMKADPYSIGKMALRLADEYEKAGNTPENIVRVKELHELARKQIKKLGNICYSEEARKLKGMYEKAV